MHKLIKRILIAVILLVPSILMAAVHPQTIPSRPLAELSIAEVRALFNSANLQYKKTAIEKLTDELGKKINGAVLIMQHDEIIVKREYGYVRLNAQTAANKINDTTCFDLASLSKQFTATAVLQLVNAGKIKLRDSLRQYFPELPYTGISIHNLLTHTSGLPEYFNYGAGWFNLQGTMRNEDVVRALSEQQPPIVFEPGSQFSYTNTNYAILALLVQNISGEPFPEYVKKHIFGPAGMSHSFYVTELNDKKGCSIATGHEGNRVPLKPHFMDPTFGDKGLYSCINDLILWKKAIFNSSKVLPRKWVQVATRQQNKLKGGAEPEKPYGYGFRLEDNELYGKLIYHGGLWHGFHHLLVYQPADNIYFVFLSNLRNGSHVGKSQEVLKILCAA